MLSRHLEHALVEWMHADKRKPLIVRGARQVGKSYLIEHFGKEYFENVLVINFELETKYKACFQTLQPDMICNAIRAISHQKINPGKTLLFFDEIQDCKEAIQSLRYFKEKMPELHIISAGSLLELVLREADFRMPVGRVSFMYLYPLTFKEFVTNYNPEALEYINTATLTTPTPEAIHQHLHSLLKIYVLLGGLPESIASYRDNQNIDHVQSVQSEILDTYYSDLGHFAENANIHDLRTCFKQIPLMIGQQIKYNKINPEAKSKDLKNALLTLELTGLTQRVKSTAAQGIPLDAFINEKKFKINFVDVGLIKRLNQLDSEILLSSNIMLANKGGLAEQFVGQELLAYGKSYEKRNLYYWARDRPGVAEVDYVIDHRERIYPIEVKSGKTGRLRSLKQFMLEHPGSLGIRLSESPLAKQEDILSIPLYLVSEIHRLLDEVD
jgi:predicted AAA+ superfamily ATPase